MTGGHVERRWEGLDLDAHRFVRGWLWIDVVGLDDGLTLGRFARVDEFGLKDDQLGLLGCGIRLGTESTLCEEFRAAECRTGDRRGGAGCTIGAVDRPVVGVGWSRD